MAKADILFFFSAKTQHENLGDAVINRELLRELVKYGLVEMNDGNMPTSFIEFVKVDGVNSQCSSLNFYSKLLTKSLKSLLFISRKKIYYVLNPGGFSGGVSGFGYFRQFFLILMYALLKIIGVRIIRLGASAGPYTEARLIIEKIKSALMHKNTIRDSVSYEYLASRNFRAIERFPDWAYMLKKIEAPEQRGEQLNVICSFRSERKINGYDEAVNNTLHAILNFNKQLPKHHWSCVSQVDFDVERNGQIAAWLKSRGMQVTELSGLNEQDYFALYHGAQYVFSNRLHVLLFALRQGAVAYAVVDPAVNTKIVGIYQDMGLSDLVIDINSPPQELNLLMQEIFEGQIDKIFSLKQHEISEQLKNILQVN